MSEIAYQINNHVMESRGGYTPNQLIFGRRAEEQPVRMVTAHGGQVYQPQESRMQWTKEKMLEFRAVLDEMWQVAYDKANLMRQKARSAYERKYRPVHIQFQPGDFVLMSSEHTSRKRNKILRVWTGPFLITGFASENIYYVQDMFGLEEEKVHSGRLCPYAGPDLEPNDDMKFLWMNDYAELEPERIIGVRKRGDIFELCVEWSGFEKHKASWTPLTTLAEDAFELVHSYLLLKKGNLAAAALKEAKQIQADLVKDVVEHTQLN